MPRPNKPWFRQQTDWWMAKIGGKSHKLAKGRRNKKAAETKFHELMATSVRPAESPNARVADICEEFLRWSKKHHKTDTYRCYNGYLQSFCDHCGHLPVKQLRSTMSRVGSTPNRGMRRASITAAGSPFAR